MGLMEVPVLVSGTATNSPPSGAAAGVPIKLGAKAPNTEMVVLVFSTAGSATMTVTVRLWGYSPNIAKWFPLGSGSAVAPDASRGVLNDGNAIGEVTADLIQFAQVVNGLTHFSRVYAEVVAIGGTATAVSVTIIRGL